MRRSIASGGFSQGTLQDLPGGGKAASVSFVTPAITVATKENFVVAGGAAQTGTSFEFAADEKQYQAVVDCSTGTFTATVTLMVSQVDVGSSFVAYGDSIISGTGGTPEIGGITFKDKWKFGRLDVADFTGTLATCDIYEG